MNQLKENALLIATSFWPWVSGTVSKLSTSVWQDWFPPLAPCTDTPGCIGPRDAIYNALNDLVSRLRDPTILSDGSTISDKHKAKYLLKLETTPTGIHSRPLALSNISLRRGPDSSTAHGLVTATRHSRGQLWHQLVAGLRYRICFWVESALILRTILKTRRSLIRPTTKCGRFFDPLQCCTQPTARIWAMRGRFSTKLYMALPAYST